MSHLTRSTLASLAVGCLGAVQAQALAQDFTLVQIPDPQYYTSPSTKKGGTMAMFTGQINWIKTNRVGYNIAYVAQMGDSVQNGDNSSTATTEWGNAASAMYALETPTSIPYGCAVGNHDETPAGDANGTTTWYNKKFGVSHFRKQAYYGGHYGGDNDSHYDLFSAGGKNYIVIYIQYDGLNRNRAALNNWANGILASNRNRKGIVVSHYLVDPGTPANWGSWQATGSPGLDIYSALRGNTNLFLMMCGHMDGEGSRQDYYNGRRITAILADYQEHGNGGNGYMRINRMRTSNIMEVQSYSPYLNQYYTGTSSQFTVPLDNAEAVSANGLLTVDGRLAMVNVFTDGSVRAQYQNGMEGAWSGWVNTGGNDFTAVTALSSDDSRLQAFALKGTNSQVYVNAEAAAQGSWLGWSQIVAVTTNTPPPSGFKSIKAFQYADGRMGIVALAAADSSLWLMSQSADPSRLWNCWENLGGAGLNFARCDVVRLNNQGLALFAVGDNTPAYYNLQSAPGTAFAGWQQIGTAPTNFKSVRGCNIWYQRLQVLAVGTDGNIYLNGQNGDLGSWGSWAQLSSGVTFTRVDPVMAKDQCVSLFGLASDGHVYANQQTGYAGGFGGWTDLGGAFSSLDGFVYVNDRLACLAHSTGGAQSVCTETTHLGGWSSWADCGGTLADDGL